MASLKDVLTSDSTRSAVISECLQLIEEEVSDKRGVSGLAIKAGYKAVKGVRPSFIREAVENLVPQFADALDPLFQEAAAAGKPVTPFFRERSGNVADALLTITDGKAARSDKGIVKSTYGRLRPSAKNHVEAAVPRLAALIERHAG
jgi:hypothetical protein